MPLVMNIPAVPGESMFNAYAGWHTLSGFSWGGTRTTRAQAAPSGRATAKALPPQLRNVTVRRTADGTLASFWLQLHTRAVIPLVKIEWLRTGDAGLVSYFSMELKNARICAIREDSTGDFPTEEIEFLYSEVTVGTRNVGNSLSGAQDLVTYNLSAHTGG